MSLTSCCYCCCSFRLLQDHSASTGVHSHALDTLKAKLEEAEKKLKSEQESQKKMEVCYHNNTALTLRKPSFGGGGGAPLYGLYTIGMCGPKGYSCELVWSDFDHFGLK